MLTLFVFITSALFAFGPPLSLGQTDTLPPHPSLLVSDFEVDVSAPFFSKAKLWILLGGAPDRFTLYERAWSDSGTDYFSILLTDDGGTKWMELYSDTLQRSTVKLPDDTVQTMGSDGIRFIQALRQVFADSGQRYLTGTVTFGGMPLYVSAVELESSMPGSRRFLVRTYDDQNTYIDSEVLVDVKDYVVTYPQIDILVTQSKVRLKLTLLNSTNK